MSLDDVSENLEPKLGRPAPSVGYLLKVRIEVISITLLSKHIG